MVIKLPLLEQDHQVYPVLITSILQDLKWTFLKLKMLPEGWLAKQFLHSG